MMEPNKRSIAPNMFYKSSHKHENINSSKCQFDFVLPRRLQTILDGPCQAWKVFQRQNDALKFSKDKGCGLMTFAFQESDGTRRFLSAHPVVFWFYDSHKEAENRRTYEVITEGAVCKLYFDLEFDKDHNTMCDGVRMTNTFIKIVCYFIKEEFGVVCNRRDILDLDSTTQSKFSRHLIFNMRDAIFRDNYNIGSFVKMVCDRLKMLVLSAQDFEKFCSNCEAMEDHVKELFIFDQKGNNRLFCDESVYSKNRHFRLYKSTKLNKNSPLLLSAENEFLSIDSENTEIPEKQLFLDSLVTYFADFSGRPTKVLEFGHHEKKQYFVKNVTNLPDCPVVSGAEGNSPVPVVDRFIHRFISPGKIRRSTYLSGKKIVYEVSGNRFCNNISREHKSNNVYYVVDLNQFVFYQKCHDPDCSGYRSQDKELPPEIVFFLKNEGDICLCNAELSDSELQQVWEAVQAVSGESVSKSEHLADSEMYNFFPDLGLSDSDLLNATSSDSSDLIPDCGISDSDILNLTVETENEEGM